MAILEAQLETWSYQGQTGQFTATYQTVKAVLDSIQSPYANRSCDSFLQGSYANDTNVHGDSDVDIVLRTRSVYYPAHSLSRGNVFTFRSRVTAGPAYNESRVVSKQTNLSQRVLTNIPVFSSMGHGKAIAGLC